MCEQGRRTPPRTRTNPSDPPWDRTRARAPARVDEHSRTPSLPLTLPNGETRTTAQEKNDGDCANTEHGARHVELSASFGANESARGERGVKPPRFTLVCKRQSLALIWSCTL